MKAYLINLDRCPERLVRMQEQFAKASVPFERVAAVDGKNLSDQELASIIRIPSWKEPLTRTEIGCFLSHRKCLELIAQGEDRFAAIFEDDVTLSKDTRQFFESTDWIPDNAELIKIETQGKKVLTDKPVVTIAGHYTVAQLRSQHILAAGYIVSRDCARKLLCRMNDAASPIDHLLFTPSCGFFPQMNVYQVSPAICMQAGLESTLSPERSSQYCPPAKLQRLKREVKRVFVRGKTGLWGLYINCFTKKRWGQVPGARD
ncbi:glycosyltransferase family 25 protein [Pseudochrobactrum algeriensis]|uniref:glycosyltransferase family 25 protein n=1 Tax=Pseudochrobactrum algeriensis TaxID=2834768 RepID=UPI001BCD4896|nr:glycosyltransferase family 25 protein [Pseudochrobactrum algeriensis]MBX8814037.1 glycosyltransferase family 25 protein [Ochrobactrum sp. MR34]QVQ36367.1 glycosyltransferase family 25 protein [Pseudochrobactrum algeriensis]QVQ39585.1 glycosyltransferase family 25 protein [Pseudochrobactrum algeriensis]QVQ43505.1 glycosyltransferase family 25 protein [Pseudochrobactrum algeriensis]